MDILSREGRSLKDTDEMKSSLLIENLLRVVGKRQSSSDGEARPGHRPEIYNGEREVSLWKPYSDNGSFRFTQSLIESGARLEAKLQSLLLLLVSTVFWFQIFKIVRQPLLLQEYKSMALPDFYTFKTTKAF